QLEQPTRFRLNVWDFAGQEKYDATHQFFLTKRSLYLFVTEARQESNYLDFDYWLNIVRLRSNSSPVIVVQNKIDIRDKEVPSQLYQQQFPEIHAFVKVSCAPGHQATIETLKMRIKESIRTLPQVGDQLPFAWVAIRHELEADQRDFIAYRDYLSICKKYGLDQQQADYLSDYYNDLGVVIHIRDHILLKDTVFLNPDWVVDGVYKVLDARLIFEKQGRFMNRDLETIWTETRFATKHSELLALMEHYELCFQLNRVSWLAPELLPADPPRYQPFKGPGLLHFQYRYVFMPAGLLTRIIVRTHEMIDRQNCWKYGCILKWEGARAEVIEDRIQKVIRIQIEGVQAKSLLAIIRRELDRLHRAFHQLDYEEMVPCNCPECSDRTDPYFFRYSHLLRFITKGRSTIDCRESAEDVRIEQLFDGTGIDRPAISTAARTLLDKLNYLREIHSTLADGARKFEIGKEIERTEAQLQRFRGKK
ncbi:MAG: COR domain-containing protein, partial [Bacteroidota bacterium]